MRSRYFRDDKGKPSIKAVVYESVDHNILRSAIDADACKICSRLKAQGHEAYIVGGAVRDLLLSRTPKDFDIATDASPARVKRLFRNSRVIGKRFRLVHIFFQDGKILEVATFRAPESGDRNHVFGTLAEDVMRRDFSLNALYYDPEEETVVDFVGGVRDIRKGLLKSVLPLKTSFVEDPVRMLRAVKYAAITGMKISAPVVRRIRKDSSLLATASISRLSEELNKILASRNSEIILRLMDRYRLMEHLLPGFAAIFSSRKDSQALREATFLNLARLDQMMLTREVDRGQMIRHLCEDVLVASGVFGAEERPLFMDVVRSLKDILKPLVQPNRDVEEAVKLIFLDRGMKIPRKRPRHPEVRAGESEREKAGADEVEVQKRRRRRRRRKPADKVVGENG